MSDTSKKLIAAVVAALLFIWFLRTHGCANLPGVVAAPPSKVSVPPGSSVEVGRRSVKVTPPAVPGKPRPTPIVEAREPESTVTVKDGTLTVTHSGFCLVPFAGAVADTGLKDIFYWDAGARLWFSRELGAELALNEKREYLRIDWRPGGWNVLLSAGPSAPLGSIGVDGLSAGVGFVLADL